MAIDLTLLSPDQLDRFLHIQGVIWRQQLEAAKVMVLRAYYDGEMPVYLTDRQTEFIGRFLTAGEFEFAHNTVKSVIDTLRERLSVSGFSVNGAALDDDNSDSNTPEAQIAALFWAWWEENRFDAQQIRLHRRALRDGKSYAMVDYDPLNQRPRLTLHSVDDGNSGICYHRDPENPEKVLFANKYWYTFNPLTPGETGIKRKTTYLPGEIRKYIMSKSGQWIPFADEDGGAWPLPWVDAQGMPLGIPLIEFENPGGSEVAQIIGLQNGLNKAWLDLIAAADASGFPILVNEYPDDRPFEEVTDDSNITGDDEFIVAPGRMIETEGHIHRIEGADLSQLIEVIWTFVAAISAVSRTPQYYLKPAGGREVPSGEALKQLESGLVSRAKERQLIFGQAWADVMAMAYKVQQTFGAQAIPEVPKLKVHTLWDSPETRNETAEAQTAQIHAALGIPEAEVYALLGYSPQAIRKFQATKRSDQAVAVANIAQVIQKQQAQAQQAAAKSVTNVANAPQQNGNGNGKVGV